MEYKKVEVLPVPSEPDCSISEKSGGCTDIAVCLEKFSLVKLNIHIPKSLEVVLGLLGPKQVLECICYFYSPPRHTKKTILIDHILTVLNRPKLSSQELQL